jgi:transposase
MDDLLDGVCKAGACWEWQRGRHRQGYGQFTRGGRTRLAHRAVYELLCGPIPSGMKVLHRCDNPPCVNPVHLFVGTQADNMADMSRKRRRHKLTAEQVETAKTLRRAGRTQKAVAEEFGVSVATMGKEAPLGRKARGEEHGRAKLTADQVRAIRDDHASGVTRRELAARFAVSKSSVDRVVSGRLWQCVTRRPARCSP